MAYIHKATVYFIDVGEHFENTEAIAEEMRNYDYLPYMKVGESETKDFDWDDEVVVNRGDCTGEQAETFFQNVKPKEVIPTYWYSVTLNDDGVENIRLIDSGRVCYREVLETSTIDALGHSSKPLYWIDVEAESLKQAEHIAKEKVLQYIRYKQFTALGELEWRYFGK